MALSNTRSTASSRIFGHTATPAVECPGGEQHLRITSQNSCETQGTVLSAEDGTALEDYFWDNVRIKEVKYTIDGEIVKAVPTHRQVLAYNFTKKPKYDESPFVIDVAVKDAGGFEVVCQRSVFIRDEAPPVWQQPPPNHAGDALGVHKAHTLDFDENCSFTAEWLFDWYETTHAWHPLVTDNCLAVDGPQAVNTYREVFAVNIDTGDLGALLYSDNPGQQMENVVDTFVGEQMVMLSYTAEDSSGTMMNPSDVHTVKIHLADKIPPGLNDVQCPAKHRVTIAHNATTATVQWQLPRVLADNCPAKGQNGEYPHAVNVSRSSTVSFPPLTNQVDEHGHVIGHIGQFAPGTYEVDYDLSDSHGNIYPHECSMLIEVEQCASPVHLQCPDEITATISGEQNYALVHWPDPNAHQDNNPVEVSYSPPVESGMPFPWGSTTIRVIARGAGNVSDSSHNYAECLFVVNVVDSRPPTVSGQKYHCRKQNGTTAPGVAPYHVCRAKSFMTIQEHPHYVDTGGYSVKSVGELPEQSCCASEHPNGTIVEHYCRWESEMVSYCEETTSRSFSQSNLPTQSPGTATESATATSPATESPAQATTAFPEPFIGAAGKATSPATESPAQESTPSPEPLNGAADVASCHYKCAQCRNGWNSAKGGRLLVNGVCNDWCSGGGFCGMSDAHQRGGYDCRACAAASRCPPSCYTCRSGAVVANGGRKVVNGVCKDWCSSSGFCGVSKGHQIGADCRSCPETKEYVMIN